VDAWQQVLNPDRYVGNDYVTSFPLQTTPLPDGSLQVIATAPGRYKLSAVKGNDRWTAYVLVRPQAVVPAIRGASFSAYSAYAPLDRSYASQLLAVAKRTGMTWADLVQTAWIDFDSGSIAVQPYCSRCPGSMSLNDLDWLIDEAYRQGFKVSLDLGVWARNKSVLDELQATLEGIPLNPISFPSPAEIGPNVTDPTIIPSVMQSYSAFMIQMAQLAQRHNVEAIIVGNNASSPNHNLLWAETAQWTGLFTLLRQTFAGKLWMGVNWTCPGQPAAFSGFSSADGVHGGLSGDIASTPHCTFPLAGARDPTAEQIAQRIAPDIDSWRSFQVQAATGLPVIYTDFYTVNVDGINFLGSTVYERGGLPKDNQEIVDLFEAVMQTVGQRPNVGLFLWSVSLSQGSGDNQDPLKQPALANAIANWWGGDTGYFAPCLASPPSDILFADSFDRGACPLERQDVFAIGGGWAATADPLDPENRVLRGTEGGFAHIGDIRDCPWTDYVIDLRVRLVGGANPVGMIHFRVNNQAGWTAYAVHVGQGQVRLFKSVRDQSQLLASYVVAAGTAPGIWHQLQITAVGPTIGVRLNGQPVIQFSDPTGPLPRGAVALGIYGGPPGPITVDFDDILVRAASGLRLALGLNKLSFTTGDTIEISLTETNTGSSMVVDGYFGVLPPSDAGPALGCPAGDPIAFFVNGFAGPVLTCLSSPSTFGILWSNRSVPGALPPTTSNLASLVWPTAAPGGTYLWFVAFTRPGTVDIVALATRTVSLTP
jgi:hypothetical protein